MAAQDVVGAGQQIEAFEQASGHQRQKGIQLEAAGGAGRGDGRVMAHHQHGHLADRLGDDRVHLAGHDGRARLAGGQADFAQPGFRPGSHQPQVAADLQQRNRVGFEDAGDLHEHVGILRGVHQVLGAGEADAGQLAQGVRRRGK